MAEVHVSERSDLMDRKPADPNKKKKKKLLFALSEKQRKELLEIAKSNNYKHYLTIRTLLETGLRINELVNLTIPEIDFANSRICLNDKDGSKYYLSFKTKTEASKRIIVLEPDLKKMIRSFIGTRKNGYVFETQKKTQQNKGRYNKKSLINRINEYAIKCPSIGQPIGAHCLRRTYASYLAENQEKIGLIQKQLGHTSVATTLRYLHAIYNEKDYENTRKLLRKMNK